MSTETGAGFPTTGPVNAFIDIETGDVRITATEGPAVADVTPTDASSERDRQTAEATTVTFVDGSLRVLGPRSGAMWFGPKRGSVQVRVQVPSGSLVDVRSALGTIAADGPLGRCRMRTAAGDIRVQEATDADLKTGFGTVVAGHLRGEVRCATGSGSVHCDRIDGRAEVRNANGDTRIGRSGGPLRVKAANGSVAVGHASADVVAATANGDVRIGTAEQGQLHLRTATGRIEVGIPPGTAVLLDVHTSFGTVRTDLDASPPPAAGQRSVEVHAVTGAGDIDVVRVVGTGS